MMNILNTPLKDVKRIQMARHVDDRGWFAEVFNSRDFAAAGLPTHFEQDNHSISGHGVLRGVHYQLDHPQGKLVRCRSGHIWDVAVDLRRSSADFGVWAGFHFMPISQNGELELLWIPEGFGHGFLVLSEVAGVHYKTTRICHPQSERSIRWNDPSLHIGWPLHFLGKTTPRVSGKDQAAQLFANAALPE
jgi:dTDP-4-dehydrorhamnose 3,5-epimerase